MEESKDPNKLVMLTTSDTKNGDLVTTVHRNHMEAVDVLANVICQEECGRSANDCKHEIGMCSGVWKDEDQREIMKQFFAEGCPNDWESLIEHYSSYTDTPKIKWSISDLSVEIPPGFEIRYVGVSDG